MNNGAASDLLFTCPDCNGFGEVRSWRMTSEADCDLVSCSTCRGEGTVDTAPEDDGDQEPADCDSDAGYDPYTGGAEDDGYDTYGDDCGCDDF